jgi:hypothetical protein
MALKTRSEIEKEFQGLWSYPWDSSHTNSEDYEFFLSVQKLSEFKKSSKRRRQMREDWLNILNSLALFSDETKVTSPGALSEDACDLLYRLAFDDKGKYLIYDDPNYGQRYLYFIHVYFNKICERNLQDLFMEKVKSLVTLEVGNGILNNGSIDKSNK